MAIKTYDTGLSFKYLPRGQRKAARHQVADIVEQYGKINYQLCVEAAPLVNNLAMAKSLPRGKAGIRFMENMLGQSENLSQSAHLHLIAAENGFADQVKKLKYALSWFSEHPSKLLEWLFWERSSYADTYMARAWNVSRTFSRSFLNGCRQRYTNYVRFPKNLPRPSIVHLLKAIQQILVSMHEFKPFIEWSDAAKTFARKLHYLKSALPLIISQLPQISTNRKIFLDQIKQLQFPTNQFSNWKNVFISVITHAYLSQLKCGDFSPPFSQDLELWVTQVQGAELTQFVRVPYQSELEASFVLSETEHLTKKNVISKNKPNAQLTTEELIKEALYQYQQELRYQPNVQPLSFMWGPLFVIRRSGNKSQLTDQLRQGKFTLWFKPDDERYWKNAIIAEVKPSRKMQHILGHPEVSIAFIRLLPPRGPARDVDVQIVFDGPDEAFIATRHLNQDLIPNYPLAEREQITVDTNRRGKYAMVTNLNPHQPESLIKQNQRWTKVDQEIQLVASRWSKSKPDSFHQKRHYDSLKALHRRRQNVRSDYHLRCAQFVGWQADRSGATSLVLEDLELTQRGTSGALAKAIESMPDDLGLYAREVLAIQLLRQRSIELVTLPAHYSSSRHVGCDGVLDRNINHYDIAPCLSCHRRVNTHYNAALFLEALHLQSRVETKEEKDLRNPRANSCLIFLGLTQPPGNLPG